MHYSVVEDLNVQGFLGYSEVSPAQKKLDCSFKSTSYVGICLSAEFIFIYVCRTQKINVSSYVFI